MREEGLTFKKGKGVQFIGCPNEKISRDCKMQYVGSAVLWDVAQCSWVEIHGMEREWCLHLEGGRVTTQASSKHRLHGVKFQKIVWEPPIC
jgi:hypothetical protein